MLKSRGGYRISHCELVYINFPFLLFLSHLIPSSPVRNRYVFLLEIFGDF